MSYDTFQCLKVEVNRFVAFVTIDHPPINLFDRELMLEFHALGKQLSVDPDVKVAVIQSADPEFFIAHADVTGIQRIISDGKREDDRPNFFQAMADRFRSMPKVTIAKIEGRARGGGSELALAMDMVFAARGRAILSQPEVLLGIFPGGGGTQRLPARVGRGRAMEIILGCEDIPADLAERYGYINRALPPDELGPFVEKLAYRIASFPAEAIALAKEAVNLTDPGITERLVRETRLFNQVLETEGAVRRMARFMEIGGQTREVEMRDFGRIAEEMGAPALDE